MTPQPDTVGDAPRAVAAGLRWLGEQQTRGGWWLDYRLGPQVSDEYATAFICSRLHGVPGAEPLVAAAVAALRERLRLRMALGGPPGWGWNHRVPADADTTALALLALRRAGTPEREMAASTAFLRAHVTGDGAATYADAGPIRRFTGHPPSTSMAAWTSAAHSVTASALMAEPEPGRRAALATALVSAQDADGAWRDLWWPDPSYPTSAAVLALVGSGADAGPSIAAAARWCLGAPPSASSGIAALRLDVMTAAARDHGAPDDGVEPLVAGLLAAQRSEGGWPPGLAMAAPDPDSGLLLPHPDAQGTSTTTTDLHGAVTTALAVGALHRST